MDKLQLKMDDESSPDQLGELRCSDLDVPLLTSNDFKSIISSYIDHIINDRVEAGRIKSTDTFNLLSTMCDKIIELIVDRVLDDVAHQLHKRLYGQIDQENDASGTSITVDVEVERNYYRVTEDDIQASIGDSFHFCFGEEIGAIQNKSHSSELLTELIAAEVTKKVNQGLGEITAHFWQSTEFAEPETPDAPLNQDMVHHIIQILEGCTTKNEQDIEIESLEDEESLGIAFCEGSSSYEEMDILSGDSSDLSVSESQECSDSTAGESPQQDKTFLTVFLSKLLDHIAQSTKTSILNMDFNGTLERLIDRTAGNAAHPQSVGNIHIPIYEELCRQFGSAKMLQAAMACGDVAFEDAVAKTLKAQLFKFSEKNSGNAVERIFGKNPNKIAPACEMNTSVSHQVINAKNGSTLPPERERERPAIRMFFSITRILKRPFTCCIS